MIGIKTAYIIPTVLPDSSALMMAELTAHGFAPKLVVGPKADSIEIPDSQVDALKLLAKAAPARFGNYFKLDKVA